MPAIYSSSVEPWLWFMEELAFEHRTLVFKLWYEFENIFFLAIVVLII
jgi:hypothetical protein